MWYLYFRQQSRVWAQQQKVTADQQAVQIEMLAKQHEMQLQSYAQLVEGHKERENRNFEIMGRYAETLEYHGACLARMETKIDGNRFCPMVRKEGGQG
jgi:hypothetical protein